jgi:hypothetical protein
MDIYQELTKKERIMACDSEATTQDFFIPLKISQSLNLNLESGSAIVACIDVKLFQN